MSVEHYIKRGKEGFWRYYCLRRSAWFVSFDIEGSIESEDVSGPHRTRDDADQAMMKLEYERCRGFHESMQPAGGAE